MDCSAKEVQATTPRLRLRPLSMSDAPDIHLMRKDPEFVKHVGIKPETDVSQTIQKMEGWVAQGRLSFAVELREDPSTSTSAAKPMMIGVVSHRNPEIGYSIKREYWNKGYASEAIQAFLPLAWEDLSRKGEFYYVVARSDPENVGSRKVLEKLGFSFQGIAKGDFESETLGWRDSACYRLERPKNWKGVA